MVRSILDVLSICSLLPKVQLIFCSQITFHDDRKSIGISVILNAADGDIVQVKKIGLVHVTYFFFFIFFILGVTSYSTIIYHITM